MLQVVGTIKTAEVVISLLNVVFDYVIMKEFMALSVHNCSILSLVKIYLVLWIKQPTTSVEEGSNKSIQYKYTQVNEVLLTK